jgi:hypothetical protein
MKPAHAGELHVRAHMSSQRIAANALLLIFAVQLWALWPLPDDTANQRIEFYAKLKAHWEATDPAKAENPSWTVQAKSESLSEINSVLADTDAVLYEAIFHWASWLLCAILTASAAIAGLRGWRRWPWITLLSLVLFMWLQQPWHIFRFFVSQGELNLASGMEQIQIVGRATPMMLVFNIVVPVVFLTVAGYALAQLKRNRNAL